MADPTPHNTTNTDPPENTNEPVMITHLKPIVELTANPDMARVYLYFLNSDDPLTVPEFLADHPEFTKSTAYEYVDALTTAGILTATGETDGATAYTAHEFDISFGTKDTTVRVTPDLVAVLAAQDSTDQIQPFIDQYGVGTLARFIDLAYDHADGTVTTRMISNILDIPVGQTYDILQHITQILDIGDGPETFTPDDIDPEERHALLDEARET